MALLESAAGQIGLALDNARLHGETRQQLDDLRRAQSELVKAERLAAVGALAGGVAHEINNPLMIILGQVHLLLQRQDDAEMLNGLRIIDGATKRAADIIKDLVLFAEHFPLRPTRCSVTDEMRHVLDLHRTRLEAHRVQVRTRVEETPQIWADTGQLQLAFFHLIQNADQAMVAAHGGGTLTVRIGPSSFGVRVEVADNGPGIPPEDLPRIFNPFFTTKAPGEGRGLGLSVADGIIAEHGGRLRADNQPEGGAVFVIELPIGNSTPHAASSPSTTHASERLREVSHATTTP
jgi:C4-dicarboxylate-specific signal transduction histidine kinase